MADDADAGDEKPQESAKADPPTGPADVASSAAAGASAVEVAEQEPWQQEGPAAEEPGGSAVRQALTIALIAVSVVGGLVGWLGYRADESRQAQHLHNLFLQVGRQAAVNLTTISYTEAEADVQRILDSSTGTFHDDFQKRAPSFISVVKQAQSKSEGTVTDAGLVMPVQGDRADVLVAVSVKTANGGAPIQQPVTWRMRISVQKDRAGAKMSRVEFVP